MSIAHALKLAGLITLVGGSYFAFQFFDIYEVMNPTQLVNYLHSLGGFGPVVFIVMMTTAVIISPIPSLPLDLAAGIAFGPMLGTVYAVIGAEIGAIVSFVIGRVLGREVISRLLGVNVVFCEKCSDHHLIGLVFVSRLLPIFSFDIVSYGAGLTNISLRAFALATLVGMIPPTFALTYLGGSIISMEWPLILSGLAVATLLLLLPKLMITYRSSWWVQLMQGQTQPSVPNIEPTLHRDDTSANSCSLCGERF
ncbi:MAG: TVP38/TMEM64 family protein [Nitrospirales bacterium]|nr:TVP38/TMEM64 family protein [Nitrospirales bacterium]